MKFEDVVHQALEHCRSVGEAKRHGNKFVVSFMGPECRLQNIFLLNSDLMVASSKIEFQKIMGTVEFIQELINNWDWIFFFNGHGIERSIINTKFPLSTWFSN